MDSNVERFDREWKAGNRGLARQIASFYVEQHRGDLESVLGGKTLEQIVAMVDGYRGAGLEEDRLIAEMWLLSEHQPQKITGTMNMGGAPKEATDG